MPALNNVLVPLVTPFTDDTTSVSEVRLARLIRFHIENGAAGFVVCTEAGEVHALSVSERKQILEWTIREAKDLPVYVNVSSSATATVLDLAQHANRHGAQAGVFTLPRLVTLNAEETASFVASVRRHGNLICGFLDPHGSVEEVPGQSRFKPLVETGHGDIALYQAASPEEFAHGEYVVTPIAVMGTNSLARIMDMWSAQSDKVRGVFSYGRSFRVGKCALEIVGVEVGRTRGPAHELDQRGAQVVQAILDSIA